MQSCTIAQFPAHACDDWDPAVAAGHTGMAADIRAKHVIPDKRNTTTIRVSASRICNALLKGIEIEWSSTAVSFPKGPPMCGDRTRHIGGIVKSSKSFALSFGLRVNAAMRKL